MVAASWWRAAARRLHQLSVWGLFGLLLLLAACSSEITLQANLNDAEANEIMTLLQRAGLHVSKQRQKVGVSILVREADLPRASSLMQANGLPRRAAVNLGEVFKKDGMISTPLEERARYLYGLTQELEFTLTKIDRVVVARVHVVLPERVAPGEPVKPSSASVFIKYLAPLDEETILPRIRRLVSTSIPGLTEDVDGRKLSIVLLPGEPADTTVPFEDVGPLRLTVDSAALLRQLLWGALAVVLAAVLAGAAFLYLRSKRKLVDAQPLAKAT